MGNIINYIKKHNPNVFSLMTSLLLALWFNGVSGLLHDLVPNKNTNIYLLLMVFPLFIFLLDNGNLNELNSMPDAYPINAAIYAQNPEFLTNRKSSLINNIKIPTSIPSQIPMRVPISVPIK